MDKKLIEKAFYGIAALGGLFCIVVGVWAFLMLGYQTVLHAPKPPSESTAQSCSCDDTSRNQLAVGLSFLTVGTPIFFLFKSRFSKI